MNTPVPKTKKVAGKRKRNKVNYVDSNEEIEEYDDDVCDKTYPPGKDKGSDDEVDDDKGWLVGCLGLNGPLRQYFSLYRAVSQREGERKEKR